MLAWRSVSKEIWIIVEPPDRVEYFRKRVAGLYAKSPVVSLASTLESEGVSDPVKMRGSILPHLRQILSRATCANTPLYRDLVSRAAFPDDERG